MIKELPNSIVGDRFTLCVETFKREASWKGVLTFVPKRGCLRKESELQLRGKFHIELTVLS